MVALVRGILFPRGHGRPVSEASLNDYSAKRGFPAGNPIANALVIIVGALVIGASLVLGFVAFVILDKPSGTLTREFVILLYT